MVSGTSVIEKRETPQAQIFQYLIKIGKRVQIDFELPTSISTLPSGQKVKVSITTSKPKKAQALITLRGDVYKIEKTSAGTRYFIFFFDFLITSSAVSRTIGSR